MTKDLRGWVMGVLLLGAGCASSSVARYPDVAYPPTHHSRVTIYHNFPPSPYAVIGEVNFTASSTQFEWPGPEHYLRVEAAKIGGDAVVVQADQYPYEGSRVESGTFESSTTRSPSGERTRYEVKPPSVTQLHGHVIRGVVIKFLPPGTVMAQHAVPVASTSPAGAALPASTQTKVCPVCGNRWASDSPVTVCPLDGTPLRAE